MLVLPWPSAFYLCHCQSGLGVPPIGSENTSTISASSAACGVKLSKSVCQPFYLLAVRSWASDFTTPYFSLFISKVEVNIVCASWSCCAKTK